ncbi:putative tRNA 2'-phosphotransferase 1 [Blattamonas nauphoetae]|uniref:2'-phosphotransferase n=1 Tax=Blattamonas nauphoetae TaxID=2049346 RepID=A0ABQ9Y367_9EUKA|nr:putative tRNA 2'-phosphotransferase 1 [Blattamonas nauphoetae]
MTTRSKNDIVAISKSFSYLLRHGATKENLNISEQGWVLVSDLMAHKNLTKFLLTLPDVEYVVSSNDKQRFALQDIPELGGLCIRANQGHSLTSISVEMKQVQKPEEIPLVLHGTNRKAWNSIKEQGLSKMGRQHIHFSQGLPGDSGIISGMRRECNVIIYIDVKKAMDAGIVFFISENGVVLSSGIDGIIPPTFFQRVTDKHGNEIH